MSAETFALHVELVCPDDAAANESLFGLDSCASATQSAGPGVPTYIFFRSAAVTRRIAKHTPSAVGLEYLELYLDARAFSQHVASDEWMAGLQRLTRDGQRLERRVYWAGSPPASVRRTRSWTDPSMPSNWIPTHSACSMPPARTNSKAPSSCRCSWIMPATNKRSERGWRSIGSGPQRPDAGRYWAAASSSRRAANAKDVD